MAPSTFSLISLNKFSLAPLTIPDMAPEISFDTLFISTSMSTILFNTGSIYPSANFSNLFISSKNACNDFVISPVDAAGVSHTTGTLTL